MRTLLAIIALALAVPGRADDARVERFVEVAKAITLRSSGEAVEKVTGPLGPPDKIKYFKDFCSAGKSWSDHDSGGRDGVGLYWRTINDSGHAVLLTVYVYDRQGVELVLVSEFTRGAYGKEKMENLFEVSYFVECGEAR